MFLLGLAGEEMLKRKKKMRCCIKRNLGWEDLVKPFIMHIPSIVTDHI